MKQRLIEETLYNGTKRYKVETKCWPWKWDTAVIYNAEKDMYFEAVFTTKEEAIDYAIGNKVVNRKEIEVFE